MRECEKKSGTTLDSIILLAVLVLLIMLGAPVGFTLILLPTVYILLTDAAPLVLIPSQMFAASAEGALAVDGGRRVAAAACQR